MIDIKPYTEVEKKCIAANCPNFICWSYWGSELHSCKLQGESNTIEQPAESDECLIRKEQQ